MIIEQACPVVLKVGTIHSFVVEPENDEVRAKLAGRPQPRPAAAWRSCFWHHDGTLYLADKHVSYDGGRTLERHGNEALDAISVLKDGSFSPNPGPEGSVFSKPGFFLALAGRTEIVEPGTYRVKTWRSTDELKTIVEGNAILKVPNGPRETREGWYGIFISRNILEMPDGTLLATANGHFDNDRIVPWSKAGKSETIFLLRTFVISSRDQGETWDYVGTVAAPEEGDPVAEGFNEPTMALLDNGELLCVMRTGHQSPLYSSRSSDGGRTWSAPVYTGLDRGCWPCLRKLADGRLALSFGVRFPAGWSRIDAEGDHPRFGLQYPAAGLVKLAVSPDGRGEDWMYTTVASGMGSCYTTMYETEPNTLFIQVDGWYWRVLLAPRIPDEL